MKPAHASLFSPILPKCELIKISPLGFRSPFSLPSTPSHHPQSTWPWALQLWNRFGYATFLFKNLQIKEHNYIIHRRSTCVLIVWVNEAGERSWGSGSNMNKDKWAGALARGFSCSNLILAGSYSHKNKPHIYFLHLLSDISPRGIFLILALICTLPLLIKNFFFLHTPLRNTEHNSLNTLPGFLKHLNTIQD